MAYLLDTCVVSDIVKNYGDTCRRLHEVPAHEICISALSVMELEYGIILNPDKVARVKPAVEALLRTARIVAFDEVAARRTARLRASLREKGVGIGAYDVLIAATALALDVTLVTSNEREFRRVPELKVENWR